MYVASGAEGEQSAFRVIGSQLKRLAQQLIERQCKSHFERFPWDEHMPRILLVEDNEMNRDMLSRRLQRKGYQILTAESGEQGLSLAGQELPDLILMDISLPEMDGWEAARRLKGDENTRHIPIIALTARALVSDQAKAFEVGCNDYDTKPVDFTRLTEKIEALLVEKKPL
jgi:two-component system, cell cycle response regulator DivK